MKLVFFSKVLNHHQACVADEFYKILGKDYCFVEIKYILDNKGGSEDYSNRQYLLRSWESQDNYQKAVLMAKTANVCIFSGIESLSFQKERLKHNLLSFDMGERWLKRGLINLFSPRILRLLVEYHFKKWGRKPLYKLCCSAFASLDHYRLQTYLGKCYKWGYFTKIEDFDVETHVNNKKEAPVSIMWCARFLALKHPELVVKLARKLKDRGYHITIDMFGSGVELEKTKSLCEHLGVKDMIEFKGNKPNEEILAEMRRHDIFLFTSDRNEGWGAVLNEAMGNGCAVVASNEIGSVPFLIKNGENGLVFQSKDIDSLYEKVVWLIEHPEKRKKMAVKAYYTMKNEWSPKMAACNLLTLIDDLQHRRDTSIKEGPCSKSNIFVL